MISMKNAQLTISFPSLNGTREGRGVKISIDDDDSGLGVVEVEISAEQFTMALSGLASRPAEVTHILQPGMFASLGKQRRTETRWCPKVSNYSKEEQRKIVATHFNNGSDPEEGWEILDYGVHRQQPGKNHLYYVRKYV